MATKLVDMGIKRKEISGISPSEPKSEKDYENEKVYPEMSLDGPHAVMMGAEDLKEGDIVEQTVRWRVKRHSATTENGKTDYRMTLRLEKASDCAECDAGESKDERSEDAAEGESPAMAYIQGRAKAAE